MCRAAVLVLIVFIALGGSSSHAQPLTPVPAGHWAYEALWHLAVAGLISFHSIAQQPLTTGEIASLVAAARRAAEGRALPSRTRGFLTALARVFPPTRATNSPFVVKTGPGVRVGTGAENWLASVDATWKGGAVSLSGAYVTVKAGSIRLTVGREAQRWGGSPRTTLLLTEHAGALDVLQLSFEVPGVRFVKFGAQLTSDPTRYLVGTRVDWMVSDRLRIGFSELVVAQPPSPLLAYWVLNPLPVVLTDLLGTVKLQPRAGTNDHRLGGVDFDFLMRRGVAMYGQLLSDDLSRASPDGMGVLIGLFNSDLFGTGRTSLRIEYSAVTNWTYTDMSSSLNHFARNRRSLGYRFGNDADDLYLELYHIVDPQTFLAGWLGRTRHGEGRVGRSWASTEEAWQNRWLSGVVETRYGAGARYERRTSNSAMQFWMEFSYALNRANVQGASTWDMRAGVRFSYTW